MKARRRLAPAVGLTLIGLFLGAAVLAPVLAPYPPDAWEDGVHPAAPSAAHWLGTDENGSDVLSRLIHGARVAALVGLGAVGFSLLLGGAIGAASGYFGGVLDEAAMRVVDVFLAFPGILLAIAIIAVTQEPSTWTVIFALASHGWVGYARLMRAQVLTLREREYVQAARALGAGPGRILLRHVVPNALAPMIVQATFGLGAAILSEASLSFLGLGPQGSHSWGALLDQGTSHILIPEARHLALYPGLAILLVVLGLNIAGDALRDRLDPKLRGALGKSA